MWLYGYVAMWLCGYVAMWLSAKIFKFLESQISIDNIFPGCSQIFIDFFEVFWYNKMNKYGFARSENQEMLEMLGSGLAYNEI